MGKVVGALIGPIAVAAYALAAAELLRGETGVELLGAVKAQLPEDILAWIARSPLASGEGAPAWRTIVVAVAVGAGAAGGLFLIVGARASAVLLWLAFLLFLGVLIGQDLVLAGALQDFSTDRLIPIAGVLGASFLFALIANFATAGPRNDAGPDDDFDRAARMRERLRSDPPPGRAEPARREEWPDPKPRSARREPPPPPVESREETAPPPRDEPTATAQDDSSEESAPPETENQAEERAPEERAERVERVAEKT